VLFLDELPEFPRNVLEILRQPIEDACVTIARPGMALSSLASFMLVAAMNPCDCGFYGDPTRECRYRHWRADSHKFGGSVLGHAGAVVRRRGGKFAGDFPEYRQFPDG